MRIISFIGMRVTLLVFLMHIQLFADAQSLSSVLAKSDSLFYANQIERSEKLLIQFINENNVTVSTDSLGRVFNQLGNLQARKGKFDSAWSLHQQVLRQSISTKDKLLQHETEYFLSVVKLLSDSYEEALAYNTKSLAGLEQLDSKESRRFQGKVYNNMAVLEYVKKNYLQSLKNLRKSMEILGENSTDILQSSNYNLMAHLALELSDYASAKKYFNQTLLLFKQVGRKVNLSDIYMGLIRLEGKLKNPQMQLSYVQMLEELLKTDLLEEEKLNILQFMTEFFEGEKRHDIAYQFLKRKAFLEDSLRKVERFTTIAAIEMETKRQLDQLQFQLMQEQLQVQSESLKSQRVFLFFAAFLSVTLFGFVVAYRRLIKQKVKAQNTLQVKNQELIVKNVQIEQTQNRLIQSEKMALLGRLSAGIAHELNNPIGAIKGNLELIKHMQEYERDRLTLIMGQMTDQLLAEIEELLKSAMINSDYVMTLEKERELQRSIGIQLESLAVLNKDLVAENLTELRISHGIERFKTILNHPNNVEILEYLSFVHTRIKSTTTALKAVERLSKILLSFKTYSFKRGWEESKSFTFLPHIQMILDLHQNILKNLTVHLKIDPSLKLYGIADELAQVWTNLLTNSVHAMDFKGKIEIRAIQESDYVLIEIEDNGGGIHVEEGVDIFEPFYTTKAEGEGTGLGLDISRQIIWKHKGDISYSNTRNGVVFTIKLPSFNSTTPQ